MGGVVCVVFVFVPGKNQQGRYLYYSKRKKNNDNNKIMKKLNSEKLNIKPPLVQSKIKPPSGPCFLKNLTYDTNFMTHKNASQGFTIYDSFL